MTDDDIRIEALCPRCVRDLPAPGSNVCAFCDLTASLYAPPPPLRQRCTRCAELSRRVDNDGICASCIVEERHR